MNCASPNYALWPFPDKAIKRQTLPGTSRSNNQICMVTGCAGKGSCNPAVSSALKIAYEELKASLRARPECRLPPNAGLRFAIREPRGGGQQGAPAGCAAPPGPGSELHPGGGGGGSAACSGAVSGKERRKVGRCREEEFT